MQSHHSYPLVWDAGDEVAGVPLSDLQGDARPEVIVGGAELEPNVVARDGPGQRLRQFEACECLVLQRTGRLLAAGSRLYGCLPVACSHSGYGSSLSSSPRTVSSSCHERA